MPRQQLMTREEFEHFAAGHPGHPGGNGPLSIYVGQPYRIVPCRCGDLNCHGWRFVAGSGEPARAQPDLTYEDAYACVEPPEKTVA